MTSQKCLLVAMFLTNSFISIGSSFNLNTLWTIQDLIQKPRCSSLHNSSATNCCTTCLGFTPVHYNTIAAVSFLSSLPVVIFGGTLTDRFGIGPCAIVGGFSTVIGNVLRLAGSFLGDFKLWAFALIVLGETIFFWSYTTISMIRNYVAGHYFPSEYRPFAVSFAMAMTLVGSVISHWTMSRFGHHHGVPAVFSICSAASTITPVCAIGLVFLIKRMNVIDESTKEETSKLVNSPAQHTLPLSNMRILVMIIASGLITGCNVSFAANSILFLVDWFHTSGHDASFYIGIGFVVCIVTNPINGFITGRLEIHSLMIVLGGSCLTAAFIIFLTTRIHPMLGIFLIYYGHSCVLPSSLGLLADTIDIKSYGKAVSYSVAVTNISVAILTTLTGVFLHKMPTRMLGWISAWICETGVSSSIVGIGIVLLLTGSKCEDRKQTKQRPCTPPKNNDTDQTK